MTDKVSNVKRYGLVWDEGDAPIIDLCKDGEYVHGDDYEVAIRRAEGAERDLRLCKGHDIVAKFRMLAAERDDMLDKLIAERAWREALEARIRELEACVLEYWHAKDWDAVGAADATAAKLLPADMKARAALKEGT